MMFFLIMMFVLAALASFLLGSLAYVAILDRREAIARQSTEGDYVYRKAVKTRNIKRGVSHA